MITLKTDRGWESPQTWEDVLQLPGYVQEIDPNVSKLFAVVGKYREAEKKRCSISTCHTKHNRGYLVTTKDGHITNIGVDCGNKEFGIEFEQMSRQLDKDWRSQQYREIVSTAKNKIEGWERECKKLRAPASWLIKQHTDMKNRDEGIPEYIYRELTGLMRAESNVLFKQRVATAEEKEFAREIHNEHIETVPEEVGILKGLSGLKSINQLREILAVDLETKLKLLVETDVDTASDKELAEWARWVEEVDSKISLVSSIIDSCHLFFTRENISLLAEIAESDYDENKVMAIAKQYD